MPAYDYRCPACNETFEITRPVGSSAEVECPSCGTAAKRVFTPVGVVFKGSGFHNTDYRARKDSKESSKESSAPSKPASEAPSTCPAAKDGSCSSCPGAS